MIGGSIRIDRTLPEPVGLNTDDDLERTDDERAAPPGLRHRLRIPLLLD